MKGSLRYTGYKCQRNHVHFRLGKIVQNHSFPLLNDSLFDTNFQQLSPQWRDATRVLKSHLRVSVLGTLHPMI